MPHCSKGSASHKRELAVIGHHELLLIELHFFTSNLPIISFGSELKEGPLSPVPNQFHDSGVEKEEQ